MDYTRIFETLGTKDILIFILLFFQLYYIANHGTVTPLAPLAPLAQKEEFTNSPIISVPHVEQGTNLPQLRNGNYDKRTTNVSWFRINSGSRDPTKYPDPNNFKISLPYKVWNVRSVEILTANIPKGQYTIDFFNQWMDILVVGSNVTSIEIARGIYTEATYATTLNNAFTTAGIAITVTYDTLTNTYQLQNTGILDYVLLYKTGQHQDLSNFNELGFLPQDIPLGNGITLQGDRANLNSICSIDIEVSDIYYSNDSNILGTIDLQDGITLYNNINFTSKRVLNPYASLRDLGIMVTFTQPFKTKKLYNFNGLNWCMKIEVISVDYSIPFFEKLENHNITMI